MEWTRIMEKEKFNEMMRKRTTRLSIRIIRWYKKLLKSDEMRIIGRQLIKSSTSTAANYWAVCRARSKAEFFTRLSIVVKAADKTIFWLELLHKAGLIPQALLAELPELQKEANELLAMVATARKNTSG